MSRCLSRVSDKGWNLQRLYTNSLSDLNKAKRIALKDYYISLLLYYISMIAKSKRYISI